MPKPVKKTDRDKPWNKRRSSADSYRIESRKIQKAFLIFCEGVNTEPEYFNSFPVSSVDVKTFGYGRSKTALVEAAIAYLESEAVDPDTEVWCVFDYDCKPDEIEHINADYNHAIKLAKNSGYKVAYSNDSFELWFVLHFQFVDSQLHRENYYEILSERLGCNYKNEAKKNAYSVTLYDRLISDENADQLRAIRWAQNLLSRYSGDDYCNHNPCTTVFELVVELNRYLRE